MHFCKAPGRDRDVTGVWDEIAGWWMEAVRDDPGQSADTHDLLDELLVGTSGRILDLGCGEGQGMRRLGGEADRSVDVNSVIGVDSSIELLRHAQRAGPVVLASLPDLSWVRSGAVDRVVSVGLLDLVDDHRRFFSETARVVGAGGHLVVVINHPVVTAPDSAPLIDPDGEILWRWGSYLTPGSAPQHVEGRTVELFHRPFGVLLTAAAAAGWLLQMLLERGPSDTTIDRVAGDHGQEHLPTLAGFRWRLGTSRPDAA
jgi:SAM-dependent methyltransferase